MNKKGSWVKFLIGFLTTIFVCTFLIFAQFFYISVRNSKQVSLYFVFSVIGAIVIMGIYLYMLYELRVVLINISKGRSFSRTNIKKLKAIGKMIFLAGVLDTIISYPENTSGVILFGTSHGGVKPTILVYIILGCLAFIIAEVFKEAVEIKEDNNLTI